MSFRRRTALMPWRDDLLRWRDVYSANGAMRVLQSMRFSEFLSFRLIRNVFPAPNAPRCRSICSDSKSVGIYNSLSLRGHTTSPPQLRPLTLFTAGGHRGQTPINQIDLDHSRRLQGYLARKVRKFKDPYFCLSKKRNAVQGFLAINNLRRHN